MWVLISRCLFDEVRGTPDQPREDAGHFGSGPGHSTSQQQHLELAAQEDVAGNKESALFHYKAAAMHGKAAGEPSTLNSANAKSATDAANKASSIANSTNRK